MKRKIERVAKCLSLISIMNGAKCFLFETPVDKRIIKDCNVKMVLKPIKM